MTLRVRFALLLGLFLAGFVATIIGLRTLEEGEREKMWDAERQTRARLLNHWLDSTGRVLPEFTADLAQSDEISDLVASPRATVLREKLQASLHQARLHTAWVVGGDGATTAELAAAAGAETRPPLSPQEFKTLVSETPSPRFFAEEKGELLEICIRRIGGRRTPQAEWIATARRWDQPHLDALAKLTESSVALRPPHELVQATTDSKRVVLVRSLPDAQGRPVRVLRLETDALETEAAVRGDWRQVQIFALFGFALIAALALALHRWVMQPVAQISRSLATKTPDHLGSLAQEPTEMGRIAELVLASFDQRRALQNEIDQRARAQAELQRSEEALRHNLEERARIARDLHDGVIQSLYAAGMSLAGIRALLHADQNEAEMRLEQTRGALNETIHDVRNFIIGLEPEALKRQTFSQAVTALLEVMQNLRAFKSTVAIDEALSGRLTLAQRVHALQIAREAVSNALRHGAANTIRITLRLSGEDVEFEVADDGSGFDTSSAVARGKGLANFSQRARELGAELVVESDPGHGTRVKLTFSLLIL